MSRRRGLTRVEILVVVGAVAVAVTFILLLVLCAKLLMSMPDRARTRAREVACQVNLKQWGLAFKLYTDDNDGKFMSGEGGSSGKWWFEPLRSYSKDFKLCLCPAATKPYTEGGRNPFGAWKVGEVSGSYGLNGWIYNPQQGKTELRGRGPVENYWGTTSVRSPNSVPILVDAMWFEGWPRQTDEPPPDENWPVNRVDQDTMKPNQNEMRRFCINRHQGHVNALFMNWSVRRVGLKELWTLKWHRNYDTNVPRTNAGVPEPMDWPDWMRNFRDY